MTGMPLASTAIIGCCCGSVNAAAMPCTDSGSGHVPGYNPVHEVRVVSLPGVAIRDFVD